MLEEWEAGVLRVLAVTPLSRREYLIGRLVLPATASTVLVILAAPMTGWVTVEPLRLILTALLTSLSAPYPGLSGYRPESGGRSGLVQSRLRRPGRSCSRPFP
ncbi:hypothetical protein [Desmospora profundinema]|uniref:ABC-2 type transporter domain-containing protein n=1 Tax=Desmospora profundinema TaxID=1571184 RepID=A0ABU1IQW6_9BACL|nr:hypothetical protein [Desmospora profundinema]MDR6227188.1 hypothetical protein [Desmospora profundinema]